MLKHNFSNKYPEAGCDEAGRGCLAGPVVAAAVILSENTHIKGLNDSKKLSKEKRDRLRKEIEQKAIAYSVKFITEKEIDEINILNASILGMQKAVLDLKIKPKHIIVDGNRFHPLQGYDHTTIVKGDAKYLSIAAASILAKTYRDEYMEKLDLEYPEYKWKKNNGYPTVEHRKAIAEFGATIHHRMSFKLLPDQLSLDL